MLTAVWFFPPQVLIWTDIAVIDVKFKSVSPHDAQMFPAAAAVYFFSHLASWR